MKRRPPAVANAPTAPQFPAGKLIGGGGTRAGATLAGLRRAPAPPRGIPGVKPSKHRPPHHRAPKY